MLKTFFSILIFSSSLQAFECKTPGPKFEDQELCAEISLNLDKPTSFKLKGHGLRSKKVAIMKFKVYTAELFQGTEAPSWDKNIDTLNLSAPWALRMQFLRDVEIEKIESAFKEGLKANAVDLNEDVIKSFFKEVQNLKDLKKKDQVLLAFGKDNKLFFFKNKEALGQVQGADLTKKILSIWLGTPADKDLEELKSKLYN